MAPSSSSSIVTDGNDAGGENIVYDMSACMLALLFGVVLVKILRDYTRRRGYIEIQQDDRGMCSNVLMGTSDSWDNMCIDEEVTTLDHAVH